MHARATALVCVKTLATVLPTVTTVPTLKVACHSIVLMIARVQMDLCMITRQKDVKGTLRVRALKMELSIR